MTVICCYTRVALHIGEATDRGDTPTPRIRPKFGYEQMQGTQARLGRSKRACY